MQQTVQKTSQIMKFININMLQFHGTFLGHKEGSMEFHGTLIEFVYLEKVWYH